MAVAVVGASPAPQPVTCIEAGWLLADAREVPKSQQSVLIADGKIQAVRDGYVCPAGSTVIDQRQRYVLPGLIDSHVHLLFEIGPTTRLDMATRSDAQLAFDGAVNARKTLMAGFTTVADLGAGTGVEAIFALREAIASGVVPGPRLLVAGQSITPTGGHSDVHGYRDEILHALARPSVCNGPYDCRRAVREQVKAGADLIKVTATGGVLSNTSAGLRQQMFDDELAAIADTAHALGRKVAAHAHGLDGITAALKAGIDSIEHGTFLDDSAIALFKSSGAHLVPTLTAGQAVVDQAERGDIPPASAAKARIVGPKMIEMCRRAHKSGVAIAFGTDSGVSKHGDNAREFALLLKAGLTPQQAITSATVTAARHLGVLDTVGTLTPGKYADLIAVDADPLADPRVLERVAVVIKDGVVVKRP